MNLHSEIMNIPTKLKREVFHSDNAFHAYKLGQKESRHVAAELSLKAEARIEELEEILREVFADSGFSCLFDELQTKISEIV